MESKIRILDFNAYNVLGEIVVEDAYIYEKINDKYTFDFTCYEQNGIELLTQFAIIEVDDDYFRIASVTISPIDGKYDVSCEHISYELNALTPEEEEEEEEDLHYEGYASTIVNEILEGTRFKWIPSDNVPQRFKFVTRSKGKRTRILEFCIENGLEIHWRKFEVATQKRRGHDYGMEIQLGENLKDLKINRIFNFNGTVEQSFDIDFIDLNKLKDENGHPIAPFEFHMGDTVYLKYRTQTHVQRGVAVGYNPFNRALPTIELESPSRDIVEVIAGGGGGASNGGGGYGGGGGIQLDSVVFAESRGILFLHLDWEEFEMEDETGERYQIPITDMSEFYIDLGELTLEPNGYVRIKFTGDFEVDSFKDVGDHWEDNPEPIEVIFHIDRDAHEVMGENSSLKIMEVNNNSGDISTLNVAYDDIQRDHPLIIYQQGREYISHPGGSVIPFEFEVVIKNTIRLYDTNQVYLAVYYIFDTERGLVRIELNKVAEEMEKILENHPNPEDLTDEEGYAMYRMVVERLYGPFEKHIFEYEMVDVEQEEIQPPKIPRRIVNFPFRLRVITSMRSDGEYNYNSFDMNDLLRVDFIGQGYSFNPTNKNYYQPPSEMGVRFDMYPYIETK